MRVDRGTESPSWCFSREIVVNFFNFIFNCLYRRRTLWESRRTRVLRRGPGCVDGAPPLGAASLSTAADQRLGARLVLLAWWPPEQKLPGHPQLPAEGQWKEEDGARPSWPPPTGIRGCVQKAQGQRDPNHQIQLVDVHPHELVPAVPQVSCFVWKMKTTKRVILDLRPFHDMRWLELWGDKSGLFESCPSSTEC